MASIDQDCVELGFIEKVETWKLCSKFFPNKVGGFPSWLALKNLPKSDELTCKKCSKPLIFLCQVYAPDNNYEACFHRTLFLFICRSGECNSENDASNMKVFRCQLPRQNKFYSFEPPKEIQEESATPGAADFCRLCRICGIPGPKMCSGCKKANYCSKEHQSADWKLCHKGECKKQEVYPAVSPASCKVLFPEFEIEMEPEEIEAAHEKTEEEVMKEYEDILRTGQAVTYTGDDEDDLIKMAAKETDKQFAIFRTRIKDYPDQVVRYCRGSEPLWVSRENQPKEIPTCSNCGGPRQFEVQVMPQLLVYLKVDSTSSNSIDWGTVLIYTCKENCSSKSRAYLEECIFKQDYSPVKDLKVKL